MNRAFLALRTALLLCAALLIFGVGNGVAASNRTTRARAESTHERARKAAKTIDVCARHRGGAL